MGAWAFVMVHDDFMAGTKEGAAKRKATLEAKAAALAMADEVQAVEIIPVATEPVQHAVYVVAPKRRLKVGTEVYTEGRVIPGAHLWPRLESWLNTGRIVEKT